MQDVGAISVLQVTSLLILLYQKTRRFDNDLAEKNEEIYELLRYMAGYSMNFVFSIACEKSFAK